MVFLNSPRMAIANGKVAKAIGHEYSWQAIEAQGCAIALEDDDPEMLECLHDAGGMQEDLVRYGEDEV